MPPLPARLTITVTAEDISGGAREDCGKCPIALAALRVPGVEAVLVDLSEITLRWRDETDWRPWTTLYDTPPEAAEFIARFDDGKPVAPLTFQIEKAL